MHVELALSLIDASHECDPVVLPNPIRLDANGEGGDAGVDRYEMHKSALTVRDYLGDTPLHCLCGHVRGGSPGLCRAVMASARDYGDGGKGGGEGGGGCDDEMEGEGETYA
eukprot:CAMPEP_0183297824 /NCGR_PEP_ID=MMETSP0160_2-20130417/5009_1 /TAXON_ID=2839 ORGANISM="Odontella Sinensis, Strain Grunow 1884" /NCGR_SAMPLE_ID=MMETSP0160_2 /ASSEMBLY_ACC=CAM_ASM_000250 /LENGTH=110 /DNA_ID=CAMNT_0025459715 /DNA_START=51 /DNA_END=380 /DNA_ORIENTATION=+